MTEVEVAPEGTTLGAFAQTQFLSKYAQTKADGTTETWEDTAFRVASNVLDTLDYAPESPQVMHLTDLIAKRKFLPGGRYLANAGKDYHQVNNCFLYRCEDSREGWSELVRKSILALTSGGGIGVDYSDVRPKGSLIAKTGGIAGGPTDPMQMVNEVARHVMSGGNRRSAIWAGLRWDHPNVMDMIRIKDWSPEIRALKETDFSFPAPLDMTNISVILNDEFFDAYGDTSHPKNELAHKIYWFALSHMLKHGEPGFSIDVGENAGETLRNACTEVTSADDSDVCNLGSINMARFDSLDDFKDAVKVATLFLLAGTEYSDIPHEEVLETRRKNRRLGLGLMGIHEWLLVRGYRYEVVEELHEWLEAYQKVSDFWAEEWAERHNLTVPVKRRAIAPNGTIGIVAETTTGVEPIFCVAQKRRWLDDNRVWKATYMVNPTAERLIEGGMDPDDIEDAYMLAHDVERRIAFQADVQDYVDHGISSTLNLPAPITDDHEVMAFGEMLMKYLPRLRGITAYPHGARGGQPLTAVPYAEAIAQKDVVFEENAEDACAGGLCGV